MQRRATQRLPNRGVEGGAWSSSKSKLRDEGASITVGLSEAEAEDLSGPLTGWA